MKFYGRNNIEFEPWEKEKHERWDRMEQQAKQRYRLQVCGHGAGHSKAAYDHGAIITRIWVADDFAKVKRGQNLGEYNYKDLKGGPFARAVVCLAGEASDRILFGNKPEREICASLQDAQGKINLKGMTRDRIDARVETDKLKDPDAMLLKAWGTACDLVSRERETMRRPRGTRNARQMADFLGADASGGGRIFFVYRRGRPIWTAPAGRVHR
jgi:hypothetical protein